MTKFNGAANKDRAAKSCLNAAAPLKEEVCPGDKNHRCLWQHSSKTEARNANLQLKTPTEDVITLPSLLLLKLQLEKAKCDNEVRNESEATVQQCVICVTNNLKEGYGGKWTKLKEIKKTSNWEQRV